ncbi:hypothetical protein FBU59_006802 [Linderina macrospora]|uniref:Uncharacterized protein n=1 Tax=Linderina macrospora TaxID=4868 RepID=A0ACC1IZ06_9FUNG|nr:hypothetical protein FBU59_006802 [Linderina macrospora]
MAVKTMDALVSGNSTGMSPASHGYANSSQSPVPTLTNSTSRSSSASSSVNSLSPGAGLATTPRDLLPQFSSVGGKRKHHEEVKKEPAAVAESRPRHKRRRTGTEKKRRLTGSADFVRRLGLYSLYEEYVRPYPGNTAQPDVVSAYLSGVQGAVEIQKDRGVSLRDLVLMPPKNEFDRLEVLPLAAIRPAFSIGGQPERPRVRVRLSSDDNGPGVNGLSGKVGIFICLLQEVCFLWADYITHILFPCLSIL